MEQFSHHDKISHVLETWGSQMLCSLMSAEITPEPTTFYAIWNMDTAFFTCVDLCIFWLDMICKFELSN